jgi:LmbE family N-acetylglucosaminyl deacetylase
LRGEDGFHFIDQELFRSLPQAYEALAKLISDRQPNALLTLAYEGGHPDHDAACFLSSQLAREFGIPVWEFPLYHRSSDGQGVRQTFPSENGNDFVLQPTEQEVDGKRRMLAAYESQGDIVSHFDINLERFRPLADYDFSRPPLPGILNYEAWQWQVTGGQVAEAFTNFLERGARQSGEMSLHGR